jgi:hypothetical protein
MICLKFKAKQLEDLPIFLQNIIEVHKLTLTILCEQVLTLCT